MKAVAVDIKPHYGGLPEGKDPRRIGIAVVAPDKRVSSTPVRFGEVGGLQDDRTGRPHIRFYPGIPSLR